MSSVDTPTYDWFISSVSDDYYDEDIQDVVMVREFYIKAKEHHIPLTNDEVIYTKGLGKRCLCLAMPYVIDYFNIQTDTADFSAVFRFAYCCVTVNRSQSLRDFCCRRVSLRLSLAVSLRCDHCLAVAAI